MPNRIKKIGYKLVLKIINLLKKIEQKIMPPEAYILSTITNGFIVSRCLSVVANLDIADKINSKAIQIKELSKIANCNSDSLYRIMRCLASVGIFKEKINKTFIHTSLSLTLKSDAHNTVLNWLKYFNSEEQLKQWNEITTSVKNGRSTYINRYGLPIFEWYKKNKEAQNLFNNAMQNISEITHSDIVNSYDFSKAKSIIDIGGGQGSLLKCIMKNNKQLTSGIVYDVFDTIDATKYKENRIQFVKGNFFDNVPVGFDIYVMKSILHDWDDEKVLKILAILKKNMLPKNKLLIIETLVNDRNYDFAKITDIAMLTLSGGKERTLIELRQLVENSNLKIIKVFTTPTPFSIVEVVNNAFANYS